MKEEDSRDGVEVEVFDYPACPGDPPLPAWDGWVEADEGAEATQRTKSGGQNRAGGGPDERDSKNLQQPYEAGFERGLEEGRKAEREAQSVLLAAAEGRYKQQLGALIARFTAESDQYLRAVEREVVKLALAIAARILKREAEMDPLLLTGAVRVALGKLAASSEVRLRVPETEVDLWRETISSVPNLALKPVVTAGEGMRAGDCVIESKVGTVDLGVRAQLVEIERGFYDPAGAAKEGTNAAGEEARA